MMRHLTSQVLSRFCAKNNSLLEQFGIVTTNVYRNLSAPEFYQLGINYKPVDAKTQANKLASNGAFVAYSGQKTERDIAAKMIVKDPLREKEIAWGTNVKPISENSFQILEDLAVNYFNTRSRLFVVDGFAGWDPQTRVRIRAVLTRSYHALFLSNMLVKPTKQELQEQFADGADYYLFNAGEFHSNLHIPEVNHDSCVSINFRQRKGVILGTQYAGQMKNMIFTIMNYLMPKQGHLPLRCSCNTDGAGNTTLFFGLSGSGKTAASTMNNRKLVGDDEHVWTEKGIFNIEGGCYPRILNITPQRDADIFKCIHFGSVLENVEVREPSREVNYFSSKITENTRASYPLSFVPNSVIPAVTNHPTNIIFLTCDASSVLPPVSKLTSQQAIFYFLSGYSCSIADSKQGVKQPVSTFSACFSENFLAHRPQLYADLLHSKLKGNNTQVWLVNTGWVGGRYGVGKRINIENTRNIIRAIQNGSLNSVETKKTAVFDLSYPIHVDGVDPVILNPENTWSNKDEYVECRNKLAKEFITNFQKHRSGCREDIIAAVPQL